MVLDITEQYVRIRVRKPRVFKAKSLRTHDIGRSGWSKRIAGLLKRTNGWATQSYLVSKAGLMRKDPKTVSLLRQIEKKHRLNLKSVKKVFDVV